VLHQSLIMLLCSLLNIPSCKSFSIHCFVSYDSPACADRAMLYLIQVAWWHSQVLPALGQAGMSGAALQQREAATHRHVEPADASCVCMQQPA